MTSTTLKRSEPSPDTTTRPRPEGELTIDTGLWLLLGLAALLLRVFDIARWPLAEGEAALALEAWRFLEGAPYALSSEPVNVLSPLAFNLNALFFALFGASDVTARLGQALGGTALVLAPWLFRPVLGRGTALGMATLLLLSPSVLFFSRHASGEIWGALCAVVLVAGVVRWQKRGKVADGLLAAVALGIGLASSPGFWTLVVAALLFLLWEKRKSRFEDGTFSIRFPDRSLRFQLSIVALLAFGISATGLLMNLQGVSAATSLPIEWLRSILGSDVPPVQPFLFLVLLYESLPLLAAIVGLSLLSEKHARWAGFGLLWLLVTLVPAALANSGWMGALLFVTVPLALLGGIAVAAVVREVALEGTWSIDGLFLGVGMVAFIFFWIVVTGYLSSPGWQRAAALFLPVVLLGATMLIIQQLHGWRAARRVVGLTLLAWFTIVSLSSAWGLNLHRGADPREPLVTQPSHPNLRHAAAHLEQISIERHKVPSAIPVGVQRSLGVAPLWYFRTFDNLSIVEGSHPGLPEAALLEESEPAPSGWIGRQVWVGAAWQTTAIEENRVKWWRWLLTRKDRDGLVQQPAILYLKMEP